LSIYPKRGLGAQKKKKRKKKREKENKRKRTNVPLIKLSLLLSNPGSPLKSSKF
jgi:hypothetical protein